jgi:hypothetical protein
VRTRTLRGVGDWAGQPARLPDSSESCGDRVWVTPTVEDCDNVDHGFSNPIVDRKWKPLRQFAVQAKHLGVYSRLTFEAIKILEQTVREVITEAFALLLVEPGAFKQIVAGFNPKLDAHRSLP